MRLAIPAALSILLLAGCTVHPTPSTDPSGMTTPATTTSTQPSTSPTTTTEPCTSETTSTPACAQDAWPRQGSFAEYRTASAVCGGGNCFDTDATFRTVYDQGLWSGTCTVTESASYVNGTQTSHTTTSTNAGVGPIMLPVETHARAQVQPDMIYASGQDGCSIRPSTSPVFVVDQRDVATALQDAAGTARTIHARYGQSDNPDDNLWTADWDTQLGLLLDLRSDPRMSEQGAQSMALTDTDAPL
jgi:hypothetical protein